MNQLLESLEYESAEGRLSLQSARYVLARPSMLTELQKSLETHLPQDAAALLTSVAQNEGAALATRLKEVFSYNEQQVLGALSHMLGEGGWGSATVEMLNLDFREIVIRIEGSPFAEEYGPSINSVCHLLHGLYKGAALAIFERDIDGQEVQCFAKGDDVCRFVLTAP
jgi:predicted hydrocarbon binding protein